MDGSASARTARTCLAILLVLLVLGLVVGGSGHAVSHDRDGSGGDCALCHALVFDLPSPPPRVELVQEVELVLTPGGEKHAGTDVGRAHAARAPPLRVA